MEVSLQVQAYPHVVVCLIITGGQLYCLLIVKNGLFIVGTEVIGVCKVLKHRVFLFDLDASLKQDNSLGVPSQHV